MSSDRRQWANKCKNKQIVKKIQITGTSKTKISFLNIKKEEQGQNKSTNVEVGQDLVNQC